MPSSHIASIAGMLAMRSVQRHGERALRVARNINHGSSAPAITNNAKIAQPSAQNAEDFSPNSGGHWAMAEAANGRANNSAADADCVKLLVRCRRTTASLL